MVVAILRPAAANAWLVLLHVVARVDPTLTAVTTVTAPPFWVVNATCLAACEQFCANSTGCQAISFGRNFNHGLQCNFHACQNLTSTHDNVLWMTYTRDSSSEATTFTQHNWTVTNCVNPQHPPLSDYDCARPGLPPGPPPPPPPPPTPLNNCTSKQFKRPRHASLWLPGVADGRGIDTARYIKDHASSYDTLSMTWAFWNSKWNSKCNDTAIGRDSGLCGRAWSEDEQLVIAAAKTAKWRVVPILEVCCVCVLNSTYSYDAPMAALVADAKDFDGYVLDMICGGHDEPQRKVFLNKFKAKLTLSDEVSWFSHGFYHPELTFPNDADFLFDMGIHPGFSRCLLLSPA